MSIMAYTSDSLHAPTPAPRSAPGLGSFLCDPYLLVLGGFLLAMASLGFAHPTVHALALHVRWPVLGSMAAIGLLGALFRGGERSAPLWLFGAVLVLATCSAAYSSDPWYSFQRAGSLWLLFLATMVGVRSFCRTARDAARLTDMLWFLGAALVVAGFVFRMGSPESEGRYGGLYDRATGAGTYGALFLPIAVYQVRHRLRGGGKGIGWLIVGLLFLQIVLAAARTALVISAVVCLALWFRYYGRRAAIAALVLAVVVPMPFVLSSRVVDRFLTRSNKIVRAESIRSFTGRVDRWAFGLEQVAKKPLLGHGLGVSRTLASFEDPRRFRLEPGEVFNLHSDQIEILIDLGAAGWLLFAGFWLATARAGLEALASPSEELSALAAAYLGGVFYVFVDTFMHGGFFAAGGGISSYSWLLLAVLLALAGQARRERANARSRVQTGPTTRPAAASRAPADGNRVPGRGTRRPFPRERLPRAARVLAHAPGDSSE